MLVEEMRKIVGMIVPYCHSDGFYRKIGGAEQLLRSVQSGFADLRRYSMAANSRKQMLQIGQAHMTGIGHILSADIIGKIPMDKIQRPR